MTMIPLNQYTDICRDAIKSLSAKLSKTFENLLMEILLLFMMKQGKINFTQMETYLKSRKSKIIFEHKL